MRHTSGNLNVRIHFKARHIYFIILFAVLGFLLSITNIYGESPDYDNYRTFFDLVRRDGLPVIYEYRFEPGFTFIAYALTSLLSVNAAVYSAIVATLMLMKGAVIDAYSTSWKIVVVVMIFYFARYYPFHELTQLRAACAIGFLMVASVFYWQEHKLHSILMVAAAPLFHLSATAVLPVLFVQPTKRWQAVLAGIGVFCLVFALAGLITKDLANYISVFSEYQIAGFGDETPNPLAATLLLDWSMIVTSLIFWNRLSTIMKRIIFIELAGMAIFYGALDFPVIANRLRELYSIFWIPFVADGLRLKIIQVPVAGFVVASTILYSYFFIFGNFFK